MKKLHLYLILAFALFIASCNSDDGGNSPLIEGDFQNGVFVLNEGGYTYSNASVSFISNSGEIHNDIFQGVNGRNLGDVAQSIAFDDDLAFIVVNNSNTVEVVNRYTFESIATIAGELHNPRYMEINNGKGYISNWGDGNDAEDDFIAVVNLSNYTIELKIPISEGPERLEEEDGKLYIAHQGGWGYGNSISIMDLNTNSISGSISVSDVPTGMVEENGFLFVLCSGKASWTGDETTGAMYKINLQNNQIVDQFEFAQGVHPTFLQIENGKVYYTIGNDIYRTDVSNIEPSNSPFISTSSDQLEILYGFNVVNGWIYACDAKDYQSNGELFVYSLGGNLDSKFPIEGIIPNGVYFND